MRRLPALGRAGRAGVAGVETARASLAAKRVSIVYDSRPAGAVDFIDALKGAGFAAAPIETAKEDRDDARQKYLLRRVAVAGFAAMNIMLISIAVWSGRRATWTMRSRPPSAGSRP